MSKISAKFVFMMMKTIMIIMMITIIIISCTKQLV